MSDLDLSYGNRFNGMARLVGAPGLEALRRAHVLVVGLGGVGSWVAEALGRSGVGSLSLVDLDESCVTNTNRQLHALDGNYGQAKVDLLAQRLLLINPELRVEAVQRFFTPASADNLLSPAPSLVVDAIDSVPDKAALVLACAARGIPLLMSGASGGKMNPTALETGDLGQEKGDALLKAVKKKLLATPGFVPSKAPKAPKGGSADRYGVWSVWSNEASRYPWEVCAIPGTGAVPPAGGQRLGCEEGFGSASFVTGAFGLALASLAVRVLVGSCPPRP